MKKNNHDGELCERVSPEIMPPEFKIIQEFVSNLVENMEDLESKYGDIISEHFWELL